MRHAKISKAPRECGDNAEEVESARRSVGSVVSLREIEVSRQRPGVAHDCAHSAGLIDAEKHNDDQRDGHENTLHKVRCGHCEESAHCRVGDDDKRADDHGDMIIKSKKAVEHCSDCLESGCCIGNEENKDDQSSDAGQYMLIVSVSSGVEIRNRKGADLLGVSAQKPGDKKEVEVGADRQSDRGPGDFCKTGDVSKSRKTHQKVAAHVRCLGAHRRDHRSQRTAADIEAVGCVRGAFPVKQKADGEHSAHVQNNSYNDHDLCCCHIVSPFPLRPKGRFFIISGQYS